MSLYTYATTPNPNLICCICHAPFLQPVTTLTCSHTFCHECILQALSHAPVCPIDRTPLGVGDFRRAGGIVESLVDELVVECPHRASGCVVTTQRQSLPHHLLDDCQWAEVECPVLGCVESVRRRELKEHIMDAHGRDWKEVDESVTDTYIKGHEETEAPPHRSDSESDIVQPSRMALLTEQNIILRHRVSTLEGTVRELKREMEGVRGVLGPWLKGASNPTHGIGSYGRNATLSPNEEQEGVGAGAGTATVPLSGPSAAGVYTRLAEPQAVPSPQEETQSQPLPTLLRRSRTNERASVDLRTHISAQHRYEDQSRSDIHQTPSITTYHLNPQTVSTHPITPAADGASHYTPSAELPVGMQPSSAGSSTSWIRGEIREGQGQESTTTSSVHRLEPLNGEQIASVGDDDDVASSLARTASSGALPDLDDQGDARIQVYRRQLSSASIGHGVEGFYSNNMGITPTSTVGPSLEATLANLESSRRRTELSLANLETSARMTEMALSNLVNESLRMGEEMVGFRGGMYGLRMQMCSVLMERDRERVLGAGSGGVMPPLPVPMPGMMRGVHPTSPEEPPPIHRYGVAPAITKL